MELIKIDLNNYNLIPKNIVACIGEFDGIHSAHQQLINKVIEISKIKKLPSSIITFDPHPDFVLNKNKVEEYVTPLIEKFNLVDEKYFLDYFIVISFTEELSKLPYQDFYNNFLKNINTIICGFDFRFGKFGQGNSNILKKLHENVVVIEKISYNDNKIGTTGIIDYLHQGNMKMVNLLLGRYYKVSGVVKEGSKIGKTMGYPTANLEITDKYCNVKNGVYVVKVDIENSFYLGIANYGYNPSFNKISKPRLEVHIFDLNENLYGKVMSVEFIEFIRDEKVFNSKEDFIKQLQIDCKYCLDNYGGKDETTSSRSNG